WHFCQSFHDIARFFVFFRHIGTDPKHREIKPVKIVTRLLLYRCGKMLLDLCVAALGSGEPACNDMVCGPIAVRRRDILQGLTGSIELAKAKRRGSKVELAVEILRLKASDLRAPRDGFGPVLFLARLRQDLEGGKRIRPALHDLLRGVRSALKI